MYWGRKLRAFACVEYNRDIRALIAIAFIFAAAAYCEALRGIILLCFFVDRFSRKGMIKTHANLQSDGVCEPQKSR